MLLGRSFGLKQRSDLEKMMLRMGRSRAGYRDKNNTEMQVGIKSREGNEYRLEVPEPSPLKKGLLLQVIGFHYGSQQDFLKRPSLININ